MDLDSGLARKEGSEKIAYHQGLDLSKHRTPSLPCALKVVLGKGLRTEATYRRKSSFGAYSFRGLQFMIIMEGRMTASRQA